MTTLLWAVLLASLVGSLHCAGMCGPFAALACGGGRPRRGAGRAAVLTIYGAASFHRRSLARLLPPLAYNGGRLATYLALGLAAGAVGSAVELGGAMIGLQRAAAILAGSTMILAGLLGALTLLGVRVPGSAAALPLTRLLSGLHLRAAALPPAMRALSVGLLTTFLPCGWLWAFVVTAAGTASPLRGTAVMGVFWLGTVPILTVVGAGASLLAGSVRAALPAITCVLLVLIGVFTLSGRARIPTLAIERDAKLSIEQAAHRVNDLDSSRSPCCVGKEGSDDH